MNKKQKAQLNDALQMLARARRSADRISAYSYGYLEEQSLVGPPTPVPPEYAIGYAAETIERLLRETRS